MHHKQSPTGEGGWVLQTSDDRGGRNQGGDDGRRSQGGSRSGSSQAVIQRAARMSVHGGVNGGRSHDGDLAHDTPGMTEMKEAKVEQQR